MLATNGLDGLVATIRLGQNANDLLFGKTLLH
jgi:hypothetical protein